MSISITLQIISTIIFLIAGVVSITKYSLRARIKIYLGIFFGIANGLWMIDMIIQGDIGYILVGILYIILGIIGIFNFKRIYRREKENVK